MGIFHRFKRLSTALHRAADASSHRDVFALEPLEQRILLSADPMLSPTGVLAPEDEPESQHTEALPKDEEVEKVELALDVADLEGQDRVNVATDETLKGGGEHDIRLENSGTVAPGNSPDSLSVNEYTQDRDGTLELEIGGTEPGTEFDEVDIDEKATLSGDLDLSFINDYEPEAGDSVELMRYGEVEGGFDRINGLHDQNLDETLLRLDETPTKLVLEALESQFITLPTTADGGDYVEIRQDELGSLSFSGLMTDTIMLDASPGLTIQGSAGYSIRFVDTLDFQDRHVLVRGGELEITSGASLSTTGDLTLFSQTGDISVAGQLEAGKTLTLDARDEAAEAQVTLEDDASLQAERIRLNASTAGNVSEDMGRVEGSTQRC